MKCNIPVKDVIKVNTVIGTVPVIRKFIDSDGKYVFLPCISYHLPTTDVRILSTETYHQLHGAHSIIKVFNVQIVLKNHNIVIPIRR